MSIVSESTPQTDETYCFVENSSIGQSRANAPSYELASQSFYCPGVYSRHSPLQDINFVVIVFSVCR